ncbi:MAG: hypothetical protein Q9162_007334 [Coniocarpon cinnabarinum]
MTEPRQRVRPKGPQFEDKELIAFLVAGGDDWQPLPDTIKVLDEIVTDYIIETCHAAAQCASYSHRQKIKVDDFKFVLRRDATKLGRVAELMQMQKDIKNARKIAEVDEGQIVKAQKDGEGATGPGRGKRRKVEPKD